MSELKIDSRSVVVREYHIAGLWDEKTSLLRALRFRASAVRSGILFTAFGLTARSSLDHLELRADGNDTAYFRDLEDERDSIN